MDATGRLTIPPSAAPAVSVLVATAPGTAHLLPATIAALLASGGPAIEVFVTGGTLEVGAGLAQVDGVRVAPPPLALAVARAPAVLLLNAGICPRPGALAAALRALDRGAGAVGGRLIEPGGRVWMAGGIVWADGTMSRYGAGLAEWDGAVGFTREAWFVQAGFIALPRPLLLAVGLPDRAFDSLDAAGADLCARIRHLRRRVAYEPEMVADLRGAQAPVTQADRTRYRAAKIGAPAADRSNAPAARLRARDTRERPRLLVLDGFVPRRAMGAGYPRAQALLNAASRLGWAVTLLPLDPADTGWGPVRAELSWEVEVCGGVGEAELAAFLRARAGYYDVVLVSRPENLQALRRSIGTGREALGRARLIYDAEALFSARLATKASLEGRPHSALAQAALLAAELAPVAGIDAVAAVSPAEAAILKAGQAAPVHVLSHPAQPRTGPPFAARDGFLFIGRLLERDAPNWTGLQWFVHGVWPLIRARLPSAVLRVVGALHADQSGLTAPGVALLGPLSDLDPAYDAARVFVAPTRFGAGVPIKVLEAAAAGLPIVTTRLIASQLEWGADAIAADDGPAAMADEALRLHTDAAAWTAMQAGAWERLEARHGAARFDAALSALLDGAAPRLRSGPGSESPPGSDTPGWAVRA